MKNFTKLQRSTEAFCLALAKIHFEAPVDFVYNPLEYASSIYFEYWKRYSMAPKQVVFLGMNPGPFGMAQTGIPFGEVSFVRDWMHLAGPVGKPPREHPKRPVQGFECTRSEVSGARLWGFFAQIYPDAKDFFKKHFVLNYCPLVFMSTTGANITPDKLKKETRDQLEVLCDAYLLECLGLLSPRQAVGVGAFAFDKLERARRSDVMRFDVTKIIHPSPASPAANRDWGGQVRQRLELDGIKL